MDRKQRLRITALVIGLFFLSVLDFHLPGKVGKTQELHSIYTFSQGSSARSGYEDYTIVELLNGERYRVGKDVEGYVDPGDKFCFVRTPLFGVITDLRFEKNAWIDEPVSILASPALKIVLLIAFLVASANLIWDNFYLHVGLMLSSFGMAIFFFVYTVIF